MVANPATESRAERPAYGVGPGQNEGDPAG